MRRINKIWFAEILLMGSAATLAFGQTTASTSQNTAASNPTASAPSPATAAAPAATTPSQNVVVTGTSVVTPSQAPPEPSLGSYARTIRKDKARSAKTFDNDNLPRDDKISVVGDASASAAAPDAPDAAPPTTTADNSEKPKIVPGQTQEQRQQVYDKWQQQINIQQGEIDQIARELDLDQREYRLRAAAFYADAGDRLRNQASWDKEDADYKQKIADQQKLLDEAKQKLSNLQEEARKSGVPESARQAPTPEQN
jgi:hypothetical protein